MSELASPQTDYAVVEREPPELLTRNLQVAAQLWASATLFFFVAFLFAFFYLRSLDKAAAWKPKHVDASTAWGTIVIACLVVATLLLRWGMVDQAADRRSVWRLKGVIALGLGVFAIIAQVIEWLQASWGPTNGGYASVYLGWTGLYLVFLAGTLIWLEVILAVSFRYRMHAMTNVPVAPGDAAGDADRTGQDIADPVTLNIAGLRACTFYFGVLTAIGVLSWILLYLIA
jgi:heme/copper-type cytochrome/quinol oxidase subunit 3